MPDSMCLLLQKTHYVVYRYCKNQVVMGNRPKCGWNHYSFESFPLMLTWLIWHCKNHWFHVNRDLKQFYMNNKSYKGGYGVCMTCIEVLKNSFLGYSTGLSKLVLFTCIIWLNWAMEFKCDKVFSIVTKSLHIICMHCLIRHTYNKT